MTLSRRSLAQAVSGPLAALMLVLSVVVPVLERADLNHRTVVESEHDPGSCPTPHDHTVCTQASANQSAAAEGPSGPQDATEVRAFQASYAPLFASVSGRFDAPARAPPSI